MGAHQQFERNRLAEKAKLEQIASHVCGLAERNPDRWFTYGSMVQASVLEAVEAIDRPGCDVFGIVRTMCADIGWRYITELVNDRLSERAEPERNDHAPDLGGQG